MKNLKTSLQIQNLKCGGCAHTIVKHLSDIDGLSEVHVQVEDSTVFFHYTDESQVEEVKTQLKKLGYPEESENNTLGLKAKSFVSCAIGKMS